MKSAVQLFLSLGMTLFLTQASAETMTKEPLSLKAIPFKMIDGSETTLNQYKDKPVLLVNIATQCGYTRQLKGLEALYKKYQKQGLVVLGVPSNDFGGQTPEAEAEVKSFCELNYGVTFPLSKKVIVKGKNKHPLIQQLLSQSSSNKEIGWNFEKFLISKNGKSVQRFATQVEPTDKALNQAIEKSL